MYSGMMGGMGGMGMDPYMMMGGYGQVTISTRPPLTFVKLTFATLLFLVEEWGWEWVGWVQWDTEGKVSFSVFHKVNRLI